MLDTNKTIVLFWFYKDIPLCIERLENFKRLNPESVVFGLYGGNPPAKGELDEISTYLEHLYIFKKQKSQRWKWVSGDHMLIDWYREVGFAFEWDRIFLLQWDIVMYKPLDFFIGEVKNNQFAIPGVRDIEDVKKWWSWYDEGKIDSFSGYLKETMRYEGPVLCSLFICALLPRSFFHHFFDREYSEEYFLEYKIPSLLKALGYEPFDAKWLSPYWAEELRDTYVPLQDRCLIAVGHGIPKEVIKANLLSDKNMIFHPCYESLKSLHNSNFDVSSLSVWEHAKLFILNVNSYVKYRVKKLIGYNRAHRKGLLKLIK